jgi:hypothetical protein
MTGRRDASATSERISETKSKTVKGLAPFIRIFHLQKTFHKSLIKNWLPTPEGISHSQTFHKSLIKNWLPTPEGSFYSIAKKYIARPHPEGSFYSIFCEKIVVQPCNNSDTPNFFAHREKNFTAGKMFCWLRINRLHVI